MNFNNAQFKDIDRAKEFLAENKGFIEANFGFLMLGCIISQMEKNMENTLSRLAALEQFRTTEKIMGEKMEFPNTVDMLGIEHFEEERDELHSEFMRWNKIYNIALAFREIENHNDIEHIAEFIFNRKKNSKWKSSTEERGKVPVASRCQRQIEPTRCRCGSRQHSWSALMPQQQIAEHRDLR